MKSEIRRAHLTRAISLAQVLILLGMGSSSTAFSISNGSNIARHIRYSGSCFVFPPMTEYWARGASDVSRFVVSATKSNSSNNSCSKAYSSNVRRRILKRPSIAGTYVKTALSRQPSRAGIVRLLRRHVLDCQWFRWLLRTCRALGKGQILCIGHLEIEVIKATDDEMFDRN